MTVVGVSMVKDEADIIGPVIDHILGQVDFVLVADNGSSDGTREILNERIDAGKSITILEDPDPAYYQSRKMTHLAHLAVTKYQADWVIPFDADEIWYAPDSTLCDYLASLPDNVAIAEAEPYDHVATGVDPDDPNPITRTGWRRQKALELPKVACRGAQSVIIGQGNHNAFYPVERVRGLVVRHFPYRSPEHFVRKVRNGAAAYAATDLPESAGAHWRQYGKLLETFGEETVKDVFRKWFWVLDPANDPMYIYDPAPIQ